jgi:hypothetical protein
VEVTFCTAGADAGGLVPPLLEPSALAELDGELPGAARRFAGDFARLWGRRHRRLADAVAGSRTDEALDAALSLKVSSIMVGAQQLACAAARLESALRSGNGDLALLCQEIAECGPRTVASLLTAWPEDPAD